MGGGNSTKTSVDIQNKQLIVNKSDIKLLAQNINKSTTNIVQETTKNCNVSGQLGNETSHTFGDVGGDFVSYTDQAIDGNLNLSCIQDSNMRSDLVKEVAQQMSNAVRSSMSSDAFAQLQAHAKTAQERGFASMPQFANKTESETRVINDLTMRNESSKELTNIISNVTDHSFSNKNLQECYATAQTNNRDVINAGNVRGNVNLTTKQNIKLDAVLSCIQKDENIMKIIEKSASVMGLDVAEEQKNVSKVKAEATAESKEKSTGPIQDVFTGVTDVVGGVSGLFQGMTAPIIIGIIASAICVVIIAVVLIAVGPKMMEQAGKMSAQRNPMGALGAFAGAGDD